MEEIIIIYCLQCLLLNHHAVKGHFVTFLCPNIKYMYSGDTQPTDELHCEKKNDDLNNDKSFLNFLAKSSSIYFILLY